jgi:hypothetical protein
MNCANFRFYGEINDFLSQKLRNLLFSHPFDWKASIKDMVESLGVPHCEVEMLVVNGRCVDFDYIVQPDDWIEVFGYASGIHHSPPLADPILLRPVMHGKPTFVLDTHLGRLASYLRMMGFDTLYRNDYSDDELAFISNVEGRILLTRDIGLLKRSLVVYGRFMRHTNPKKQIVEVLQRYQLTPYVVPLQRCLKCNGELTPVEKSAILHQLTPTTAQHYDVFHQCSHCGQIYWKGAHYDSMQAFMAEVMEAG